MLARNPKTGGTIRLMKSDSSIWKNRKTLVWMKEPPTTETAKWARWDIAVDSLEPSMLEWKPQFVILINESPRIIRWLATPAAKNTRFILISRDVVNAIGEEKFQELGLGNVLCLEEFSEMYPFIGPVWDGTIEDAILCASVIFRYQRLIGLASTNSRLSKILLDPMPLKVMEACDPPEDLVLIQQYYKPLQAVRAKEIDKCLAKNIQNPLIDRIYLFVESKNMKLPKHPKLVFIEKKQRITYADCIQLVQDKIGERKIAVFANSDIYLDDTWSNIWSSDIHDVCLALLRWEEEGLGANSNGEPELYGPRADSQDTWVLHSDSVLSRSWNLEPFKIPFGTPGCDNAILVEFLRNKFLIVNPAMSLRTMHVHKSQIRNYDPENIVDRPVYMHVEPTGIHELNPLLEWTSWTTKRHLHEPLDRPLKATTAKTLGMFCSQINRESDFTWVATGPNTYYTPVYQDNQIDIEGGGFVSCNGLVYRYSDLCVGKTEIQKELWSDNQVSHLMPAQMTEAMMCFPLEQEWLENPALYTLYYLSRVIKQHQETPEASFWCKRSANLLPAFRLFKWNEARGHLLHYSKDTQAFSSKIVGRTAHGVRIMPTDVDALRSNLYCEWTKEPIVEPKPVIVIVADDAHIKEDLLNILEKYVESKSYELRVVFANADASNWAEALSGASRVILSTSIKHVKVPTWAWLWMAPIGCAVLELQEEREPSDSLVHLCAAAKLDWTLLQYPRATPEGFKKIVMKEVEKWFQMTELINGQPTTALPSLPMIFVPPKSMKFGFFGHKGDSFRELVDMWAERGYVEQVEDPIITQCWLGGVGKILLYDRPTWNWLEKSSESEKKYTRCLAGNPDSSEKSDAKPWIFWPRRPKLVEKQAQIEKPYSERSDNIVFYGRVENDTQGKFRQDISGWKQVCDKFSMPIGAKEPYMLGPEEYLVAIQNAKYGLCLRGYGPKCNREIELLAMGTVPLLTPGVDMNGYIEPLVDGVNVICVSSPEDAIRKTAAITEDKWTAMSKEAKAWWQRNASAEGSWQRTSEYSVI